MILRFIASQIYGILNIAFAVFSIVLGFLSTDAFSPERYSFRIVSIVPLPGEMISPYFLLGLTHLALGVSLVARRPIFTIGSYVATLVAWAASLVWFAMFMQSSAMQEGGPSSMGGPVVGVLIYMACWGLYFIYFLGFLVVLWSFYRNRGKTPASRKDPIWAVVLIMIVILLTGTVSDVAAFSLKKRRALDLPSNSIKVGPQMENDRLSIKRRFEAVDPTINPGELYHLQTKNLLDLLSNKEEVLPSLIRSLSEQNNMNDNEQKLLIIQTIGACGPAAKDALPALCELWKASIAPNLERREHIEFAVKEILNEESMDSVLQRSTASVTLAALEMMRLPSLKISDMAQDRMLEMIADPSISRKIRQSALFVVASRDLLEMNDSQISQLEMILRNDPAFLDTLRVVLYDSAGFQSSQVQYSPIRTVELITKLGADALPVLSALCSCLGHQDQEHYVPKIVEAIKRIGPTAIPYLEQERDYKPPETRLKRILELLEAMQ